MGAARHPARLASITADITTQTRNVRHCPIADTQTRPLRHFKVLHLRPERLRYFLGNGPERLRRIRYVNRHHVGGRALGDGRSRGPRDADETGYRQYPGAMAAHLGHARLVVLHRVERVVLPAGDSELSAAKREGTVDGLPGDELRRIPVLLHLQRGSVLEQPRSGAVRGANRRWHPPCEEQRRHVWL